MCIRDSLPPLLFVFIYLGVGYFRVNISFLPSFVHLLASVFLCLRVLFYAFCMAALDFRSFFPHFLPTLVPPPFRFVRELARVCAPGGRVLVITWCHRDLEEGETSLQPDEEKLLSK